MAGSSSGDHNRGVTIGKFIAAAKYHQYRKNCKPSGWPNRNRYAAHHILCVGATSDSVAGTKGSAKTVIKNTVWNINDDTNMIALPIWGDTIKYYCTVQGASSKWSVSTRLDKADLKPAPAFKNLPQHNYGHDVYITDVDEKLEEIMNTLASEAKVCKATAKKNLKSNLDTASKKFRKKLVGIGGGGVGTHRSWRDAEKGKRESTWYQPFRMSKSAPGMTFVPLSGKSTSDMFKKIKKYFS